MHVSWNFFFAPVLFLESTTHNNAAGETFYIGLLPFVLRRIFPELTSISRNQDPAKAFVGRYVLFVDIHAFS
jgi:hypothetical protein